MLYFYDDFHAPFYDSGLSLQYPGAFSSGSDPLLLHFSFYLLRPVVVSKDRRTLNGDERDGVKS